MTNALPASTHTIDVIGDVHGAHGALVGLLDTLGYASDPHTGSRRRDGHLAVFVGDVIDKGPDPAGALALVKAMCDAGSSMLVLGNPELNWIRDAWRHRADPERFLAATCKHPCRRRMAAALGNDPVRLGIYFDWLRTQPLALDFGHLRVVHAWWHEASIEHLRASGIKCLDDKAMLEVSEPYSATRLAIERVLCGVEHDFDSPLKDPGYLSRRQRVAWWNRPSPRPFEGALPVSEEAIADAPVATCFGHYGFDAAPGALASRILPCDFGVAYGGPLVATRIVAGGVDDPTHQYFGVQP
jgi:hypothetical protein